VRVVDSTGYLQVSESSWEMGHKHSDSAGGQPFLRPGPGTQAGSRVLLLHFLHPPDKLSLTSVKSDIALKN
jgi:hypothetical protein